MTKNRKERIGRPARKAGEKPGVAPGDLTDELLDQVSGGAGASIAMACCNGKHIPKVIIH